MNTRVKLTDEQQADMDKIVSVSSFRQRKGRHRLSEFVGWVFMGMPFIAPLPNMFSLLFAIGMSMGGHWYTYIIALFICASIELMLVGVSEQLNGVIDEYLRAKPELRKMYYGPLALASLGALLIVAIMLGLVYHYEVRETDNYTAMALPFISILSVMFMGVRSYMDVVSSVGEDADERMLNAERTLNAQLNTKLNAQLNELTERMAEQGAELVQYTEKYENLLVEHNQLKAEHSDLKTELAVKNERANMLEDTVQRTVQNPFNGRSSAVQRRDDLLEILSCEYDGVPLVNVNKSALAGTLGTSHTTISRDLKALEKSGAISLNGTVKVNR